MAKLRGVMVLNAMRFVRETFGADAHEQVLAALAPGVRATLVGGVREASCRS